MTGLVLRRFERDLGQFLVQSLQNLLGNLQLRFDQSDGAFVDHEVGLARFGNLPGDHNQSGHGSDVARGPQHLNISKAADEAVARSTALLGATQPSSGRVALVLEPRFVGFDAPDEFLVGYGLDYAERYRHLPFVGSLNME